MALTKCTECKAEISDKAASCPNCGSPVKRKTSWATKLILGLIVTGGLMTAIASLTSDPQSPKRTVSAPEPKRWSPSAEDKAKQPDRQKLMKKFGPLWSKWEACESINLCLYVRPAFYGLEVDQKQQLVQLFWTYYAVELGSEAVAVRLRDARSGKNVGVYERNQLTMN